MTYPTVWPGSPDARTTDPATSHEAADSITLSSKARSQWVVMQVLSGSLWPLTDRDIEANAGTLPGQRFSGSRLRTARHELEDMGLVREAGKVIPPGARTHHRTWEAVAS